MSGIKPRKQKTVKKVKQFILYKRGEGGISKRMIEVEVKTTIDIEQEKENV